MPSNLKVNVYSVSARFSLRHQPCGITRWRGELIKTAHDGFALLFPRNSRSFTESWHGKPPHCTAAHMWFIRFYLLFSKKNCRHQTFTCYQSHIISQHWNLMKIYGNCELYEIIQEKNPIYSAVLDQIHQIQAFTGSGKCISDLQRATYLHLFHTLFI